MGDHDVEPAEPLDRAVNQRRHRPLVGNVGIRPGHPLAGRVELPRGGRRHLAVDVGEHHARAALQQRGGGGEPDAARRAGHDRDAVLECSIGHRCSSVTLWRASTGTIGA